MWFSGFRYGSGRLSLAHLRQLAKTDAEGTTALGLIKAAEKLGFTTQAIQTDESLFNQRNVQYPFIAHVLKNGKLLHYYTVFKFTRNKILIGDPDPTVRKRWMKKEDFFKEWTGIALFFVPGLDYQPTIEKKESLFSFIPMLLKQRQIIVRIILASIMIMIIDILGSYYFQILIDTYIPNRLVNDLTIISLGLLIAYGIQQILTFVQNFLLVILGQRMTIDLVLGYLRHVFELPMSFFATRRTGEIISRFNDANKIIDALASIIISLFLDIWIVVLLGIVLAIQSWKLFLITLISLPAYVVVIFSFIKLFQNYNQKTMQSNSILNSSIIESISGIETIKSLNCEGSSYQKIDHEFVDYLKNSFIYSKLEFLQQTLKNSIRLILNVFILWFGARLVIQNKMSLGQLITYNTLLSYFINPLQNIINLQTKFQSARVANNRLNEVYLVKTEFNHNSKLSTPEIKDITFNNVGYRYGFGRDILRQINLQINFGDKIAIVGMSGSGKSTLVKLLVNFYQPTIGNIYIGSEDIQRIDKKSLRQKVNYLPQEPYLFSGTILENLQLGNRAGVTFDDIREACASAEIEHDIEKMPLQYKTELSENGGSLSGGQRQRLTIARSLLTDADILIFDESTSNLDAITEKRIVDKLISLPNKTVIFVAHRLELAKRANKVVVLDDGKLVEYGTHEKLLENHSYYFELVNK